MGNGVSALNLANPATVPTSSPAAAGPFKRDSPVQTPSSSLAPVFTLAQTNRNGTNKNPALDPEVKRHLDGVRNSVNPPNKKPKPSTTPPTGLRPKVLAPATTPKPGATPQTSTTPSGITPSSSTQTAALRDLLNREIAQHGGGIRNLDDMVTNPALNPAKNAKAAALWQRLNQTAYAASQGTYGVDASGTAGTQGTVLKMLNVDKLRTPAKPLNASGTVVYSVLGAVSSFNINKASGLTSKEALAQLPAGFARDLINIGLSNVPLDIENPYIECIAKGATGGVLTVITNAVAGKVYAPAKPTPVMNKGMILAAFTVNGSLTAVNQMQKNGMLGGVPPENPSNWFQWAHKHLFESAAIGVGVYVPMAPASIINKLRQGVPLNRAMLLKTGWMFALPAGQNLIANIIVNPPKGKVAQATSPPERNGGNQGVADLNSRDAYLRGANPFQRADDTRDAAGNYVPGKDPVAAIAAGVLKLQKAIRTDAAESNVRTNAEAADVVLKATRMIQTNKLGDANWKTLKELSSQMDRYGIYFASSDVKYSVEGTASTQERRSVTASDKSFVRTVFAGQIKTRDNQKTEPTDILVDLATVLTTLLSKPKIGLPFGIAAAILRPTGTAVNDTVVDNFKGFEQRMQAGYGGGVKAMGVKLPQADRLSSQQKQTLDNAATQIAYAEMIKLTSGRKGSATEFGRDNMPQRTSPGAGALYTTFQQLSPAQLKSVKAQVQRVINAAVNKALG
jgi:hypothetical protein